MTLAELSALSDDELNVMLAECEEWVAVEDRQTGLWTAENVKTRAIRGYHAGLSAEHCVAVSFPKFCSDLNETARVARMLTDAEAFRYFTTLANEITAPPRSFPTRNDWHFYFYATEATARQRTIALIAVKKGIK